MKPENVTYSAELEKDSDLKAKVAQASNWLQDVITKNDVTAAWDYGQDERGRELISLELRDSFQGEVHLDFATTELDDVYREHVKGRFYEASGALVLVGTFRSSLDDLIHDVQDWLKDLPERPFVEMYKKELNERRSGKYSASCLRIGFKGNELRLEPVAAFVIPAGFNGRVDLIEPDDRRVLMLQGTHDWQWVIEGLVPRLEPVTKDNFLEVVKEAVA